MVTIPDVRAIPRASGKLKRRVRIKSTDNDVIRVVPSTANDSLIKTSGCSFMDALAFDKITCVTPAVSREARTITDTTPPHESL